jgi:hypothetical protein
MGHEDGPSSAFRAVDTDVPRRRTGRPEMPDKTAALEEAYARLDQARRRLLSASIAFCDGSISAGQLRAVRELLRETEQRIIQLGGDQARPFVDERAAPSSVTNPEVVQTEKVDAAKPAAQPAGGAPESQAFATAEATAADELPAVSGELRDMLLSLDQKIARLEQDFQQGRINASQYRAIRRHYLEQRQVAIRLRQAHPESERWRVVLEEGKTSFLLQLNEASCRGIGFYEINSRERLYLQGNMPASAEEAMALLGTFGASGNDSPPGRMLATQAEDGTTLLLIPGRYTAALVVFSQDPPGWQVRALREVHQNFEAANKVALGRHQHASLIFPDLSRFIRS